jgi:hypothetical protein
MKDFKTSTDTSAFELPAELDPRGRLTPACAAEALARMEADGFVILTGLLTDA